MYIKILKSSLKRKMINARASEVPVKITMVFNRAILVSIFWQRFA